jgi:hypothetical protein
MNEPHILIRDQNCSALGPGFLFEGSQTGRPIPYLRLMPRKPIELPPQVAKAFVRDMRTFFRAKDPLKQDEIAAGTSWMLQQHFPRGTKLRLTDVKELFLQMRDHA